MPVSRATHAFAVAPGGAYTRVVITGTFTTSTGVVSSVVAPPGFSLGNFTSGVATLSFPKSLGHLSGRGSFDIDSATAANRRSLLVNTVALSSGTATVRLVLDSDGSTDTTHSIGTGAFRIALDVTD
jgi:hypothetical protein